MMKKYWKRLFGVLMTLCMMSTILVPSAMAGEVTAADFEDEWTITDGIANSGTADDVNYIPVSSGVRAGVNYLKVYPAKYDEDTMAFTTSAEVYLYAAYPSDDRTEAFQVSPEDTASILAEFKAKTGEDANAWSLTVSYTIYTDGKGSYAKYYEFDPEGNCLDKTPIKANLSKSTTSFTPPPITIRYRMPDDTSGLYRIGISGGFYYYSASAKKELSTAAGAVVRFNSTVSNF